MSGRIVETLAQIRADGEPTFTAGLVLHDDVVVEAAPIIAFMKRNQWTRDGVRVYCEKRGWQIRVVNERELR